MQHLPRIPFGYAKANQILLIKAEAANEEDGVANVPSLIHSPETDLAVLQEICRLVGPIRRIEQSSEEVLEALNAAYSEGDLNASQVVDEVEEAVDLSRLLQEMPVSEDLLEMNDDAPVIRMINSLLKQASRDGASDIHL
jgi:general secretion pathway protein E